MITVRESVPKDINILKSTMRKSDQDEIWASHRHTPEAALRLSMDHSAPCYSVLIDNEPIAMFGIVPHSILGTSANIWLLASDRLCGIRKSFIKYSRNYIRYFLSLYPVLSNYVDVRNRESIRWLKWCGAMMGPVVPIGKDCMPFQYFQFRR